MTCMNCKHARWELTKAGHINMNRPAECRVPLAMVLPVCVDPRQFHIPRKSIWAGEEHQCPLWKKLKGKPKAKGAP